MPVKTEEVLMRSIVPAPDPTKLTTDAVNAATDQWRRDLESVREIITARIDGIEQATDLRISQMNRIPEETARLISHLRELTNEKFESIDRQFTERDIRTDQAARSSKEALDAALLAAKELVGAQNEANASAAAKSETSFTKQIDQIGTIIQTLEKALDARITELKERIDRGGGFGEGSQANKVEFRDEEAQRRAEAAERRAEAAERAAQEAVKESVRRSEISDRASGIAQHTSDTALINARNGIRNAMIGILVSSTIGFLGLAIGAIALISGK